MTEEYKTGTIMNRRGEWGKNLPPKLAIEDVGTKFGGKRKAQDNTSRPQKKPEDNPTRTNSKDQPPTKKPRTHFKNIEPKTPPKSRNMTCKQMVKYLQKQALNCPESDQSSGRKFMPSYKMNEVEPNTQGETQAIQVPIMHPPHDQSNAQRSQIITGRAEKIKIP